MKNILTGFLLLVSFGSMTQITIGFVDFSKLLDTIPSRKVAAENYLAHEKELTEELRAFTEELNKSIADSSSSRMYSSMIWCKIHVKRQHQLEERQQSIQQELQAYAEYLNKSIVEEVQKAIDTISKRENLSMVVEKSSTLYYYEPNLDITDMVVTELLRLEKESR